MNRITQEIVSAIGTLSLNNCRTGEPKYHLHNLLDIIFITGLVFSLFLGGKVTPILFITGILPIPFLLKELRSKYVERSSFKGILPFFIYFTYNIWSFVFFTGLGPADKHPVNPSYEFYVVAISMLIVGIVRGLQVRNLSNLFRYVVPIALLVAFVVLTTLMFFEVRDDCRVSGAASWPFVPALLFTTLTLLSLVGWATFSPMEKRLRFVLLACSIVVVNAYTASRGVAVGQFAAISILSFLGMHSRFSHTLPRWHRIFAAVTAGIIVSAAVGLLTGCGPMTRILPVVDSALILVQNASIPPTNNIDPSAATDDRHHPAQTASPSAPTAVEKVRDKDQSIGLRLDMWRISITSIGEAPLFGHGALYLQKLITERFGFEHNHNQYLSWLVTGGIVGMAIGLYLLAVPWLVSAGLTFPDRTIITVAITVVWGGAMMFDSFFNLKFYMHYYAFLCGVLYAWVTDLRNITPLRTLENE